jgi:SAM-dependent methyltransferase
MNNHMPTMRARPIEAGSPDRFGYEWKTYSEMIPEYEEQFCGWTSHIPPGQWRDKTILDVGCGMGRNTYWPLTYGAKESVSIDVDSNSLASARRTLERFPQATVREMSAYDIAFTDYFDIVYSIGVIHHLEHPGLALRQMVKAAKPGGCVLIWVYGRENNEWIVKLVGPVRKALFCWLPIRIVHHISLYPAVLLWLALRSGFGKIQYFRLIRKMKFFHIRSIVFDQMLPIIANYWPREEVEQLMREAGLLNVRLAWVNQMSWAAIGIKPIDWKDNA